MPQKTDPVLSLSKSPQARFSPVSISSVRLTDDFWQPRREINRRVTLPAQWKQCEETGRLDNFRRVSGRFQGAFQGIFFNDSDVYKWAEAAAFSLSSHPDSELDGLLDSVIAEIAAAQQPDGYLNTYFSLERAHERYSNLKDMHEIYCAGHLIQAAVAHHRATGKENFLGIAIRLADHLSKEFGAEGRKGACGHEEAEMALVELYRETSDSRYLDLALRMTEARGGTPGIFQNSAYHQDHLPLVQQTEMTGHAVRHLYYLCGATDLALERGLPEYQKALSALWQNFTLRRAYVTGGAGARYEGEAFGNDYELPNDRAYAETCAAIASVMWNFRLLHLTGEARFADLLETTLYNAVLPGLSLDGLRYFYENPLSDRGAHRRQEWFGCACCPPNIARLLASLPGYFYSVQDKDIYLHLYAQGTASLELPGGGRVTLTQETRYPWNGEVRIQIESAEGELGTLWLRIPEWAEGATVAHNGSALAAPVAGSYFPVRLNGVSGETVSVSLPMPVTLLESHSHLTSNLGRVAVRRGPLIYCLEQADHPNADVWDIALPKNVSLSPQERPELLGGMVVLTGEGRLLNPEPASLYRPVRPDEAGSPVPLTLIPYYAWANREAGAMQVWIPLSRTEDV